MKSLSGCAAALALSGPALPLAHAVTAASLNSFEGIEEPLVRYAPATETFVRDSFVNITDLGGAFRMELRYQAGAWDGDRDTRNKDRQRAEVKGLGPHQKTGETFEYATTWRTSAGFHVAPRFCHVFQLKSTDGSSGAPLVTLSTDEGKQLASVRVWSGREEHATIVREFPWTPDVWQTVRIRIKTSDTNDGEVLASVNGDEFQGARGIAVHRPAATDYRPKWGFYRGVAPGLPLGDDYVEHKDISARKIADAQPTTALAEANAVRAAEQARGDPAAAMAFAESLAPADGRAEAMQRTFNRWTDQNPDAVLRWAAAHPRTAELDSLLWYFATDTTLRYTTREKALAGAALIADPELRARAFEHIVLIWARRHPAEAARYVAQSAALTSAQKDAIRQKIHVPAHS